MEGIGRLGELVVAAAVATVEDGSVSGLGSEWEGWRTDVLDWSQVRGVERCMFSVSVVFLLTQWLMSAAPPYYVVVLINFAGGRG